MCKQAASLCRWLSSISPTHSPHFCLAGGTVVMRIPLRLAITDQVDEEEEGEAAQQEREQPWSVRLAGCLLAKAAEGDACPWAPYLAVSDPSCPGWIPVVTGPLCRCSTCCLALAAAF